MLNVPSSIALTQLLWTQELVRKKNITIEWLILHFNSRVSGKPRSAGFPSVVFLQTKTFEHKWQRIFTVHTSSLSTKTKHWPPHSGLHSLFLVQLALHANKGTQQLSKIKLYFISPTGFRSGPSGGHKIWCNEVWHLDFQKFDSFGSPMRRGPNHPILLLKMCSNQSTIFEEYLKVK